MGIISKTGLLNELYKIGEGKANYKFMKMALLAIFAGMFIALAGFSYIIINTGMSSLNSAYAKFISGICFSFGLFAVIVAGADLFTGNILMVAPLLANKITVQKMLRNWCSVYIFNFVGAIFIALLVYFSALQTPEMQGYLHKICLTKTTERFAILLFRGIGCNIFVCIGVWMCYACKDGASKFLACIISIIPFIVCGFEHSVANMFYLSLAYITQDISLFGVFYDLLPVTIGNIIGGAIVGAGYHFIYKD